MYVILYGVVRCIYREVEINNGNPIFFGDLPLDHHDDRYVGLPHNRINCEDEEEEALFDKKALGVSKSAEHLYDEKPLSRSMIEYTGGIAHTLNDVLRGHTGHMDPMNIPDYMKLHNEIQGDFAKAEPLNGDLHTYHGTTGNSFSYTHGSLKPGDRVKLLGYTSTTLNPRSAASWGSMNGEVLHFHHESGSRHGIYIGHRSLHPDERSF